MKNLQKTLVFMKIKSKKFKKIRENLIKYSLLLPRFCVAKMMKLLISIYSKKFTIFH